MTCIIIANIIVAMSMLHATSVTFAWLLQTEGRRVVVLKDCLKFADGYRHVGWYHYPPTDTSPPSPACSNAGDLLCWVLILRGGLNCACSIPQCATGCLNQPSSTHSNSILSIFGDITSQLLELLTLHTCAWLRYLQSSKEACLLRKIMP